MTKKRLSSPHTSTYQNISLNRLKGEQLKQKKNLDTSSYNFIRENHRNKIYFLRRFVMGKFNINL